MTKHIKHIFVVSASTMLGRILGLARDSLTFACFGASWINSAFIFAFTLPNLFRRLFGEGALTSALVPLFAEELEHHGRYGAFRFLNQVITRITIVLLALMALAMLALESIHSIHGLEPRWYLGARLGILMMPYMPMICIAALVSAVLNVLEKFAIAALSPIWLNVSMIIALGGFGYAFGDSEIERVYFLSYGFLIGGFLQMIIPMIALWKMHWRPKIDFHSSSRWKQLVYLFLPGLGSAAIFQVNIVVNRLLAFHLNASAASILYLANRLIELPLGVFTIAVITVIFPKLSLLVTKEKWEQLAQSYNQGMRLILAITVPAALGLATLSKPILIFLFEWGKFGGHDVDQTQPILIMFGLFIPIYSFATFATRGFHALKDTQSPVKITGISFVLNFILALIFMHYWGTQGLALANIVATTIQAFFLQRSLVRKQSRFSLKNLMYPSLKIALSGVLMTLFCHLSWLLLEAQFGSNKLSTSIAVLAIIPLSMIFYFYLLWLLHFEDRQQLKAILIRLMPFKSKS